jgi:hypothetical protein
LLWLHMRASREPTPESLEMSSMTDPRRRWRRYDFHVPVTLTAKIGNQRISASGTGLNEGGITVCAETELPIGDELKMEFRPPFSNTVVSLPVVVRNRSGNRYGMEFMGSSGAERQEIVLLRTIVKMLEARVSYYRERATNEVLK